VAFDVSGGISGEGFYSIILTMLSGGNDVSFHSKEGLVAPELYVETGGSGGPDLPPAAPSNLMANAGDRKVSLTWTANSESDLAGYRLYRSNTSGEDYALVVSLGLVSSYKDEGLVNGQTYFYVLSAVDLGGHESGFSNEVSATPVSLSNLRPPISPKWVFEPVVWEDNVNTQTSTWELVTGYLQRDIPVGGVIIDSPWEYPKDTGYNTFEFDHTLYPNPQQLITDLNNQGVHVILWMTGVIAPPSPNYDFACQQGYFVKKVGDGTPCPTTYFWKAYSRASHVDFFNPDALSWWHSLMDNVLDMGVDGWKVDQSDYFVRELGETIQTYAGVKTKEEYSDAYYRSMYENV